MSGCAYHLAGMGAVLSGRAGCAYHLAGMGAALSGRANHENVKSREKYQYLQLLKGVNTHVIAF